jgi:hypothetical protein
MHHRSSLVHPASFSQEANAPRRWKKWASFMPPQYTRGNPSSSRCFRAVEPHPPPATSPISTVESSLTLTPHTRLSHEAKFRPGCHAALQCKSMRWQSVTPYLSSSLTVTCTSPPPPQSQGSRPLNLPIVEQRIHDERGRAVPGRSPGPRAASPAAFSAC